MATSAVSALLTCFVAALAAEDVIPIDQPNGAAGDVRTIIDSLRRLTREAIEAAILAPSDPLSRAELLDHAIDFDGLDSPLVARCAQALADAIAPPVVVTAA